MKYRILILPCSTQIGVEQYHSLKYNKHFELWGASHNSADRLFTNFVHLSSNITSFNFIDEIQSLVNKLSIDVVLPAHDEINFILKGAPSISSLIPGSSYKSVCITRFKSATYEQLLKCKATKEIVPNYTLIKNKFIKPNKGQGSRGTLNAQEEHLVCELLPGKEYTIDCFNDKTNNVLYVNPRIRSVIENGISEETEIIEDNYFFNIAKSISKSIELCGSWFFQMKEDENGKPKIMEVAPRIAGGSNINRLNGINLTLLHMYQHMGLQPTICFQNIVKCTKRKQPKYNLRFNTIFLDYDDTYPFVIETLALLNKKIIIVTRSKTLVNTPFQTIYVSAEQKKSDVIKEVLTDSSIFIDDSFRERHDVFLNLGIPAIAPEEAEYLL